MSSLRTRDRRSAEIRASLSGEIRAGLIDEMVYDAMDDLWRERGDFSHDEIRLKQKVGRNRFEMD